MRVAELREQRGDPIGVARTSDADALAVDRGAPVVGLQQAHHHPVPAAVGAAGRIERHPLDDEPDRAVRGDRRRVERVDHELEAMEAEVVEGVAGGRAHQRRAQPLAAPIGCDGHATDVAEAVMVLGLDQHVAHHLAAFVGAGEQPSGAAARGEVAYQLPAVQRPRECSRSGPLPQRVGAIDPRQNAVAVGGLERAQRQLRAVSGVSHATHDASSAGGVGLTPPATRGCPAPHPPPRPSDSGSARRQAGEHEKSTRRIPLFD